MPLNAPDRRFMAMPAYVGGRFNVSLHKKKTADRRHRYKTVKQDTKTPAFFKTAGVFSYSQKADAWRKECWQMIKERKDCTFLFLTKRIDRFLSCIPDDWGGGYENVAVCCTVENQKTSDYKIGIFEKLPIKHKCITAQPLIEAVDLEPYLDGIELVVVGGESDPNARPLDYAWVLDIRDQCIRKNVPFEFRQCGTHFIKDGKEYKLQTKDLCAQARKAGINFKTNR